MSHSDKCHHPIQLQRIIIPNKNGEKFVGILHESGSMEVVIICHGFRSSKDRIPIVNLAAAFGNEGISAFRFDFARNGESEGSFQYGNYRREADELRIAVKYFHGEKCLIAAIGHSKGGNVVLLYSSRYNDVNKVVGISGRFDLERGIEGCLGKDFFQRIKRKGFIYAKNRRGKIEYRVTEASLMDRLTTYMLAVSQTIQQKCRLKVQFICVDNICEILPPFQRKVPACKLYKLQCVLTVHGSKDEIVPVEDAMEFA